jgi:hypothetical protein
MKSIPLHLLHCAALVAACMAALQTTPSQAQTTSNTAIPAQKSLPAASGLAVRPMAGASRAGSGQPSNVASDWPSPYSGLVFMGCRAGTPVGQPTPAGKPEDVWTCINSAGVKACESVKPASVKQCILGQPKNYP